MFSFLGVGFYGGYLAFNYFSYCAIDIGVSKSFYVTTTDNPTYKNRTYDVLGIGVFGMSIDKDAYNKIYKYLKAGNCLNLSDSEELANVIGERSMISGVFENVIATSLLMFNEPTKTLEGTHKRIVSNIAFIPFFSVIVIDQNRVEHTFSVTFQSIVDFDSIMYNGEIICYEDIVDLDIVNSFSNSLTINSIQINSTSIYDSIVKATYNGRQINLVSSYIL
jgi:hypothetical protein